MNYFINLDEDVDRCDAMNEMAKKFSMQITRFPAFRANNAPPEIRRMFKKYEAHLKSGEKGCYASHLQIAKMLSEDIIHNYYLILEDDITFDNNFTKYLENIILSLPPDWDRIILNGQTKYSIREITPINDRTIVQYSKIPIGARAYLLSKCGAHKIIKNRDIKRPIDVDLQRPWQFHLNTYGIHPQIVYQSRLFYSSIDRIETRKDGTHPIQNQMNKLFIDLPHEFAMQQFFLIKQVGLYTYFLFQILDFIASIYKKLFGHRVYFLITRREGIKFGRHDHN